MQPQANPSNLDLWFPGSPPWTYLLPPYIHCERGDIADMPHLESLAAESVWCFLSCDSSLVHQQHLNRLGCLSFKWSSKTSPMIQTNLFTLTMNSSLDLIFATSSSDSKWWVRSLFTLIQFACLKLSMCSLVTLGNGRSRIIITRRWSASGRWIAKTTLHHAMGSSRMLLHQMLSGHIQFPATDWKFGIPWGRARSISFLYKSSIRGVMNSSISDSLSLTSSSQMGWWQLKSLSQMTLSWQEGLTSCVLQLM